MDGSTIALLFSGVTLLIMVGEKLFGGGNALAEKFRRLEKDLTTEVSSLRRELTIKVDEYSKIQNMGFEAIKSNIHALQLASLEFRAKMAEELHNYIHKDAYNAGVSDIKADVQRGFRDVSEQMGRLQDLIMHVNPDIQQRPTKGNNP